MILQTQVERGSYADKIGYDSSIVMVGSCFSTNIYNKLNERKFRALSNPLGTIYNPKSIVDTLSRCEKGEVVTSSELFYNSGVYGSFCASTLYSNSEKSIALDRINSSITSSSSKINSADFLIITLGTNRCYYLKDSGVAVSNCHKFRADVFDTRSLEADEIVELFSTLFDREPYNKMSVVFTVSPVRYSKYGFVDNSVSKAHLLIAINRLTHKYDNVSYFPAYEIFNDELRDYRFYDSDLIHPSPLAIDYVWEIFASSMIKEGDLSLMNEVEDIIKRANHRPFNRDSDSYRKFAMQSKKKMEEINKIAPNIDFREEKEKFL